MAIRPELPDDYESVRSVNLAAFPTSAEANLVDALRGVDSEVHALVAEIEQRVVGHILFSPVAISTCPQLRWTGLGPMAVEPGQQRSGIGSALVHAGLKACAARGMQGVVVLGHANFYPRFGFRPASEFGLRWEHGHAESFFALELEPGSHAPAAGVVTYHPAFNDV